MDPGLRARIEQTLAKITFKVVYEKGEKWAEGESLNNCCVYSFPFLISLIPYLQGGELEEKINITSIPIAARSTYKWK